MTETQTLEVEIVGTEKEPPVHDVQDWIRRQGIPGLQVEQKPSPATPEGMGVMSSVLSVVTSVTLLKDFVKSLFNYLVAKRQKLKVTVRTTAWEVTLDGENLPDLNAVLDRIDSYVDSARGK
jgi:hypothetical protein